MTSPNSLLQRTTPNNPPPPSLSLSVCAAGAHKAFGGIVHEAQLEAMLVLKGLRQGVTQVVGGQGALPAVLELGKNTLKGGDEGSGWEVSYVNAEEREPGALKQTFNAQKMQESPRQKCPGSFLRLRLKMSRCQRT